MKSSILFIIIILVSTLKSFGDNNNDSLRIILNNSKTDIERVDALNNIAFSFINNGSDSILYYSNLAISISQKTNYKKGLAKGFRNIGEYYNSKGIYKKAISNFIESYKLSEFLNDNKAMSNVMNSIGNTYLGINNNKKALESYTKSYEFAIKDSNFRMIGISSIGLGNIYLLEKNNQKALELFIRAKNTFINNAALQYPLSISYSLIGSTLIEFKKYDEAFLNFNKALELLKTNNNTYGVASTYELIAKTYLKKGDLDKALFNYHKAFQLFKERKAYDNLKDISLSISNVFKQKKDFENAYLYSTIYSQFRDSIISIENNKQIIEIETKYESKKKEDENKLLQSKNELNNKTIKEQKVVVVFIILSLVLLLAFTIFVIKNLTKQKKSNTIISNQKKEVETKNSLIEEKQKEILDSINYAKRIQETLLPNFKLLSNNLGNQFVLFNPKDIVSGDFYWATEHNNKFYLAVCDCTGHGVPGAFMSFLNMGFLSEAIKEKNITEPGEIFNYVRDRLINSISKDGQQDGMDGILVCIDKTTKLITYCAANNDPILISNNKIIELPKDKMPVGKGEKNESFKTHTINGIEGDFLYLYTDGYADQFGGPKGKKFKYKPLNEMLLALNEKTMENQKEILNSTLLNWKGNLEQVDDILIVGIKL